MEEIIKVITVAGITYIGKIDDSGPITAIINAVSCSRDTRVRQGIVKWFEQDNLGKLETLELKGTLSYTVREFNEIEKEQWDLCCRMMGKAQKTALKYAENKLFYDLINPDN